MRLFAAGCQNVTFAPAPMTVIRKPFGADGDVGASGRSRLGR